MSGIRLTFNLPGIAPAGKARPRVTRHGTFMPPEYKAWQELIRWQVRAQVPAAILGRLPLTGRLAFECVVCGPRGVIRPDIDNFVGAIFDSVQIPTKGGWGLIANDRQIKRLSVRIEEGPTAIHFMIEEL
jgi:Holliday junction resolvase RusA-like endonuclease